jgi:hypothetical protein
MLAYAASKNEAEHAMTGAIVPTPESLDELKAANSTSLVVSHFTSANQDPTLTLQPVTFIDVT